MLATSYILCTHELNGMERGNQKKGKAGQVGPAARTIYDF